MKPLKLTMQAFGSYGNKTTVDFTEPNQNLFLVTGDTGAGKTTIFDAIVFALYGEASSSSNKKEGVVLQSQFADLGTEPFVELMFSDGSSEDCEIYTVRRVPRHMRVLTRGTEKGKGTREITSSITLFMPDGTEYPQKEANNKLEEIVGLTKDQFMQVAMIAQGEFMELLRASSKEKKEIFRKLFHTEFYQNIVNELDARKHAKERDLAIFKTERRTIAEGVVVPEGYEHFAMLEDMKIEISKDEFVDSERFLKELKNLCDELGKEKTERERTYQEAIRLRDEKQGALISAEGLLEHFHKLDRAERDLAECEAEREKISEMESLIGHLRSAYEIQTEYERFKDASEDLDKKRNRLEEQNNSLPGLELAEKEASEKETEAKKRHEEELEGFSQISERVTRAIEVFERIGEAEAACESDRKSFEAAKGEKEKVAKQIEDLKNKEKERKEQLEELKDAEVELAHWEGERREASDLKNTADKLVDLQKEAIELQEKEKQLQREYSVAREDYHKRNSEYETKRRIFLDAQAGFLAKELTPGKPCPVCGSLEHPDPCEFDKEHEELSEEALNDLSKEVDKLRSEQERLSADSKSNGTKLGEKENSLQGDFEELRQRAEKNISDMPKDLTVDTLKNLVEEWEQSVQSKGEQLQKDADALKEVRNSLKEIEDERERLSQELEEAGAKMQKLQVEWEKSNAALQNLKKTKELKEYPSREAAENALQEAEQKKNEQEHVYHVAKEAYRTAKEAKDNAETLIRKYTEEMPELTEKSDLRKKAYEEMMQQKNLPEAEWRDLTENHTKAEIDESQEEVNKYKEKRTRAEALKQSAKETIGVQSRPVIEDVQREKEEAEQKYQESLGLLEACKNNYSRNKESYDKLAPRAEENKKIAAEHKKISTLYNLTSGKISGSRMDLETYVQRYYLEKALYAANRHFQNMSAGQFELHMVELEKAGDGRNKGLDLMVYSNVTGKEREIRTLSGGESFMAALSLALGMADQIQENSAAINLDIMFVDEGFGSLDEHSRNQAVKVLQTMAEGDRLIGIISHVTELKQEIENQLAVSKNENGSYVKWQIS